MSALGSLRVRRGASLVRHCVGVLVLASVLAPSAALACSVCIGAGSADTQNAYRAMTAFMTFTPIAIVGSVIYWIWRRFKALEAEEAARMAGLAPRSTADLGQ